MCSLLYGKSSEVFSPPFAVAWKDPVFGNVVLYPQFSVEILCDVWAKSWPEKGFTICSVVCVKQNWFRQKKAHPSPFSVMRFVELCCKRCNHSEPWPCAPMVFYFLVLQLPLAYLCYYSTRRQQRLWDLALPQGLLVALQLHKANNFSFLVMLGWSSLVFILCLAAEITVHRYCCLESGFFALLCSKHLIFLLEIQCRWDYLMY